MTMKMKMDSPIRLYILADHEVQYIHGKRHVPIASSIHSTITSHAAKCRLQTADTCIFSSIRWLIDVHGKYLILLHHGNRTGSDDSHPTPLTPLSALRIHHHVSRTTTATHLFSEIKFHFATVYFCCFVAMCVVDRLNVCGRQVCHTMYIYPFRFQTHNSIRSQSHSK